MKEKTKTWKVYKFDELTDQQQQKAVENYYDINVDHDWYEPIYEGANESGLKILAFDIERGAYCKGKFISGAEECAHKIEKNYGENCETFKIAKVFLKNRDEVIDTWKKDENGDFIDQFDLDVKLDDLESEFLHDLLEDYLSVLRKEYEYLTRKEAIVETLKSNDYDFTEEGKID